MKIHFLVYFLYIEAKLWTCLVHELMYSLISPSSETGYH